ncbi:hypothetical protein ACLKA7_014594 [Drosophila subpalustris]
MSNKDGKSQSASCGCPNPSCRPQTPRPTCRPPPSLFSKLNCTACNRLFFFIVGYGIAYYYDKIKEEARKAQEEANKDPKQKEKERKEREKKEKEEKDKKEKEKKEQEKKDKERKAKEQKDKEKEEKDKKAKKPETKTSQRFPVRYDLDPLPFGLLSLTSSLIVSFCRTASMPSPTPTAKNTTRLHGKQLRRERIEGRGLHALRISMLMVFLRFPLPKLFKDSLKRSN